MDKRTVPLSIPLSTPVEIFPEHSICLTLPGCSKFSFMRCFSTEYLPFLLKICVYVVFSRYFLAIHTA